MTEAEQPEALRLANALAYCDSSVASQAAAELRRQHARIAKLEQQLVAEAAKTAAETLRANQMTEQHRMQAAMRYDLEQQMAAIGAGGVEPLRSRQCLHQISEPSGWRPIETAPVGKEMFVARAIDVLNGFTGGRTYTSDPWCVWQPEKGKFSRWNHHFQPTHWMPLPSLSSADEGGSNG